MNIASPDMLLTNARLVGVTLGKPKYTLARLPLPGSHMRILLWVNSAGPTLRTLQNGLYLAGKLLQYFVQVPQVSTGLQVYVFKRELWQGDAATG
jgi:hypothetical protein